METKIDAVPLSWTNEANIIVGQSHFIKTVEDIAEIMASSVPGARYGLAFNEASGPCLVRTAGNDEALVAEARASMKRNGLKAVIANDLKDVTTGSTKVVFVKGRGQVAMEGSKSQVAHMIVWEASKL